MQDSHTSILPHPTPRASSGSSKWVMEPIMKATFHYPGERSHPGSGEDVPSSLCATLFLSRFLSSLSLPLRGPLVSQHLMSPSWLLH